MIDEVMEYLRETPCGLRGNVGKYQGESPFDIWLALRVLGDQSWPDEETGDVDWRHFVARIGRRVVTEDSFGFVRVTRFDDEAHACAWFDAEAQDYEAWNNAADEDWQAQLAADEEAAALRSGAHDYSDEEFMRKDDDQ